MQPGVVYDLSVVRTSGSYTYTLDVGRLVVVSDDEWRLTNAKSYTFTFDGNGELTGVENWLGDGVTYLDGVPNLAEVLLISGEELSRLIFTRVDG